MQSQFLIIGCIIVGSLVLIVLVCFLSFLHFRNTFKTDIKVLLHNNSPHNAELLTESDLDDLPEIVRKYIRYSGAVNKPRVVNFSVKLEGTLRQNEQSPWMSFTSTQYNGVIQPARLFFLKAIMKHLPVSGYHRCISGVAYMDIRLLSLFRVQHAEGPQLNIAEAVTMFNDMCVMAPATLIDKRISWSGIGDQSVVATFSNGGIVISANLYFNSIGELVEFISHDRYAVQPDGSMQRYPWVTPMSNYHDYHGTRLASQAHAVLKYPAGDFCYGTFKVNGVRYNID